MYSKIYLCKSKNDGNATFNLCYRSYKFVGRDIKNLMINNCLFNELALHDRVLWLSTLLSFDFLSHK